MSHPAWGGWIEIALTENGSRVTLSRPPHEAGGLK